MNELRGTRDIKKLLSAVPLIVQLIPFEEPVRKSAFRIAFGLLLNGYPAVRIQCAEQLISVAQTHGEDIMPEEVLDDVLDLLMDHSWGEKVDGLRDAVSKLRELFQIEAPKKVVSKVPSANNSKDGENVVDSKDSNVLKSPPTITSPTAKESDNESDPDIEDDSDADIED